jgi:ribonuclease HII
MLATAAPATAASAATKRPTLPVRHTEDDAVEVGLDEAGRGCFWGPMMAGAVVWPRESEWTAEHAALAPQIRDSKKISPKKRDRIADDIERLAIAWGVGVVTAAELDEKGVTWANQEAFRRAIGGLKATGLATVAGDGSDNPLSPFPRPDRLLIDGELSIDDWPADQQHTIVEGDGLFLPIAAASILAKVHHDRWVQAYCDKNAECAERYGLRTGKGYGTQVHRDGLTAHGAHELHRRTFIGRYVPAEQALARPNVVISGYRRNFFTLRQEVPKDDKKGVNGGALCEDVPALAGAGAGMMHVPTDKCIIRL